MVEITTLQGISHNDQRRIADISIRILNETGFKFDPKFDSDLFELENVYLKNNGSVIIAKDLDLIIGCIMVKQITAETAEIRRLRLLPEYRGNGIGKQLLQTAVAFCKKNKFSRIILDTTKKNPVALNMFLKSGFIQIRQDEQSIFLGMDLHCQNT